MTIVLDLITYPDMQVSCRLEPLTEHNRELL